MISKRGLQVLNTGPFRAARHEASDVLVTPSQKGVCIKNMAVPFSSLLCSHSVNAGSNNVNFTSM